MSYGHTSSKTALVTQGKPHTPEVKIRCFLKLPQSWEREKRILKNARCFNHDIRLHTKGTTASEKDRSNFKARTQVIKDENVRGFPEARGSSDRQPRPQNLTNGKFSSEPHSTPPVSKWGQTISVLPSRNASITVIM